MVTVTPTRFSCVATGVLILALNTHTCNAASFLHRVDDGSIWLGTPLVGLGMIGVMDDPPQFHLSDELARELAPIINRFQDGESRNLRWWHKIPRARKPGDPTILISMTSTNRCTSDEEAERKQNPRGIQKTCEIVSATVQRIEVVPRVWLDAWDRLDEAVREIVEASRIDPGDRKKQRLTEAIEKGSDALTRMYAAEPPDEQVRSIRAALPKARIVRTQQRSIEREWGGHLRRYVSTLAIQPVKPLPPAPEKCSEMDRLKLLWESDSAAEFMAKIKKSCLPEDLDEVLTCTMVLAIVKGNSRSCYPMYAWEFENMSDREFQAIRSESKENSQRPPPPYVQTFEEQMSTRAAAILKDKWGVVVSSADDKTLADKLLLRGMVVEDMAESGSPIGLMCDDIIIDYDHVYDLSMGGTETGRYIIGLASKARGGGELRVLRGNSVITLVVEKDR
ncbi:MAG TPA: hypothetical protein VLM89_08760 [Phycisphaerae bacterium]|nr:hypothetical protein [Phycisphaerae bacterium]